MKNDYNSLMMAYTPKKYQTEGPIEGDNLYEVDEEGNQKVITVDVGGRYANVEDASYDITDAERDYRKGYNTGLLARWDEDQQTWVRSIPTIELIADSKETEWIKDRIANPSLFATLTGRDPEKDWMGLPWEGSFQNPYYMTRTYETNPIARSVMDITMGGPGTQWGDIVANSPLALSALGIPTAVRTASSSANYLKPNFRNFIDPRTGKLKPIFLTGEEPEMIKDVINIFTPKERTEDTDQDLYDKDIIKENIQKEIILEKKNQYKQAEEKQREEDIEEGIQVTPMIEDYQLNPKDREGFDIENPYSPNNNVLFNIGFPSRKLILGAESEYKEGGPLKFQDEGPMIHPITGQNMMGTQPPTFMTSVSEGGTVTKDGNIVEDYFKKSGTSENVYSLSKYQDESRNIEGTSSFTSDFGTFYKPSDVNPTGEFSMVSSKTVPKERSKLGKFFTGQTHHPTKVESSGGDLVFGKEAATQWLEKFGSQSDDKGLTESTIYAENYGAIGPVIELMGNVEEGQELPVQDEFEAAGITETPGFTPSTEIKTDFKTQENLKEGGPIKYQTIGQTQIGLGNQAQSINSAITAYNQSLTPPVPFNPDDTQWMEDVKDPNEPSGIFGIAQAAANIYKGNQQGDKSGASSNPFGGPGGPDSSMNQFLENQAANRDAKMREKLGEAANWEGNWGDLSRQEKRGYRSDKKMLDMMDEDIANLDQAPPPEANPFNTGTGDSANNVVSTETGTGTGTGTNTSTGTGTGGGGGGAGGGSSWDDTGVQKAGSVAALAGTGIKMLADDKDATTFNVGEIGGSMLQGAGTGAKIGANFGPMGAAAGAVIGAGANVIGGWIKRNKARKEQAKEYVRDAQASVANRNVELTSKTYTGFDTGKRFTAKLGGTPYIIR